MTGGHEWCTLHRMKPQRPTLPSERPDTEPRVRLTISVSPAVHETYTRMAHASSMSVSRCMGDWLADTLDAAQHVTRLMEKARAAPKVVAREMHAYALGLADETTALMDKLREKGAGGAAAGRSPAGAAVAVRTPPPSNTGGKVPSEKRQGKGKTR